MRALVYLGPGKMEIQNWEIPVPGPGEVRIKGKYVGVCGSDIKGFLDATGRRIPPMVMGHEIYGTVSAVGEGVEKIKEGDRVAVHPILACGRCSYCRSGMTNICPDKEILGVMHTNGAFAEEFCVPEPNVCKIPDTMPDTTAALIEPFAVAYRAVSHAMPVEGKTVMICGAGPIGLMILKICDMINTEKIIMLDRIDHRLDLAKRHGADILINPGKEDIAEILVKAGLRNNIDIAFEAAGITPTVQQTVDYVRNCGQIIWVGNSNPMVTLNMHHVVSREIAIKGSYVYTQEDFLVCVDLLSRSELDFDGIVSDIISLGEAPSMFEQLGKGPGKKVKVLVDMTI